MPCCIVALLALFGPRLILVLIWLFNNNYLNRVFTNWFIPLLGFLFLPWTTLAFAFAANTFPGAQLLGLSTTGALIVLVGLLFDFFSYGGSGYSRRNRFRSA
jgi:hypothetical protein